MHIGTGGVLSCDRQRFDWLFVQLEPEILGLAGVIIFVISKMSSDRVESLDIIEFQNLLLDLTENDQAY